MYTHRIVFLEAQHVHYELRECFFFDEAVSIENTFNCIGYENNACKRHAPSKRLSRHNSSTPLHRPIPAACDMLFLKADICHDK